MRNTFFFLYLFFIAFSTSCDPPKRVTADRLFLVKPDGMAHYDLKNHKQKFFLPYALEEISGLSFVGDGVLACIQDEDARLFLYNYHDKKIVKSVKFWNPGDYEGVEIIGDTAYVVNSKGDLLAFDYKAGENKPDTREVNTKLGKKNDIEGLCFDRQTNSLLMVCKGESEINKKKVAGQAVYRYDLSAGKIDTTPVFTITKKDIKNFLEIHKDNSYEEKRINFRPSGIAPHPIDGHFYIIASTGKLLLVVDRKGKIQASYPISPGILGQPEGICFAPNGDMFISSEGEGDKGYILRFEMQ